MKQRLPAYRLQNTSSDEKCGLNDTVHNVFWLLTLIALHTPDKNIVYLSFYRTITIAQQEGIRITPTRF
ncbi:hypothetical protein [Citrobacter portucalensis]|uniref:hypothetical protein n=1 Tax=Citrobacter portucalensis TaxID=1639133 RepID=UPI00226B0714|nr:hypothetical protein [Citrobacter portucalensis]MCX8986087.1 hypothetical protein [Citrobacter portucalensis]